ncbi:MAG: hypothetical protein HYT80_07400 [Euryarchaeota archaeon]|nr:hypothetical protein [Euryarchaeota archaeon]
MKRTASSLALLVLLVLTVPSGVATDEPGAVVSDAKEKAEAARSTAEREAGQKKDEAVGAASDAQEEATAEADSAAYTVGEKVFEAYDLVIAVGTVATDLALGLVRDATSTACPYTCPLTSILDPAPDAPSMEGGRSVSSSKALFSESGDDALLWVAASTTAGLGVAFLLRRLVSIGLLPFLSRIAHHEIYENDARRTIHELIVTEPGLCLNELVSRTGYSRNAVSYHLFVLEKEEEIVSVKDGKYRRYFLRNGKYVNGAKNVVAALRNETTLKLARTVVGRPGAIQRDICIELGATPSAACWHAKRLLDLGVIRKERVANTVRYFPGEALHKYDLSDFGLPQGATPAPQPV